MITEPSYPNAREYLASLAVSGRYHFAPGEVQSALGVSAHAAKLALNRLKKQNLIASPARGFYVIIPPEYRTLDCLPADQFIPAMMQRLNLSYYAGLLSAAQYHGAAHHRPQEFQVFLEQPRRRLKCGAVRVAFIVRKNLKKVPIQSFNTPRGTILVSTPETTALDLVGYQHHAGGLDQIVTIFSELAEKIDPEKLAVAARFAPVPWGQRLGYLLEQVGASDKTIPLKAYVRKHARQSASLLPSAPHNQSRRDKDWKLYVNAEPEVEI